MIHGDDVSCGTPLTPPTPQRRTWNSKLMEDDVFCSKLSEFQSSFVFLLKGLAVSIERMGNPHSWSVQIPLSFKHLKQVAENTPRLAKWPTIFLLAIIVSTATRHSFLPEPLESDSAAVGASLKLILLRKNHPEKAPVKMMEKPMSSAFTRALHGNGADCCFHF